MTQYRTLVPNAQGGYSTHVNHLFGGTADGGSAVALADRWNGYVEVSDNGVIGWEFYYAPAAPDSEEVDDHKGEYVVSSTQGAREGVAPYATTTSRARAIHLAHELHGIRVENGATGTDSVRVELAGAVIWAIRDNGTIIS